MRKLKKGRKSLKFSWEKAQDIKVRTQILVEKLGIDHVNPKRVFFFRSTGSKTRAYARTWGLPAIWQSALNIEPAYIIEVLSKYFDNLPTIEQDKVILHELSHIPKTFSGALTPHTKHKKGSFHDKLESLHGRLKELYENNYSSRRKHK